MVIIKLFFISSPCCSCVLTLLYKFVRLSGQGSDLFSVTFVSESAPTSSFPSRPSHKGNVRTYLTIN